MAFYNSVGDFHAAKLIGSAVSGDRSYSEWEFDFTLRNGARVTLAEVCARRWRDGRVVFERFYWNQGAYPAPQALSTGSESAGPQETPPTVRTP